MSTPQMLDAESIRKQLDRMVRSPTFAQSERLCRFLRFTVDETLAGRADQLKESVIGMEVFDRSPALIGRDETIVRVEARRLRAKLEHYYTGEGSADPVRITLPKGGYVPAFAAPPGTGPALRSRRWLWLAAATTALVLIATALWIWRMRSLPAGQEAQLKRLTFDEGLASGPSLSGDGRLIAFASDRAGRGDLDIWVQQLSGGDPVRITTHAADDYDPDISADGSRIAFRSERDGGGIYVVSALGGNERLVSRQGFRPRLSPDGKTIAYHKGDLALDTGLPNKVFTIPVSGGEPRQVASELDVAWVAIWSPDGKALLISGCKGECDWWAGALSVTTRPTSRILSGGTSMMSQDFRHPVTRRDLLKTGALGLLSRALPGGMWPREAAADLRAGVLPAEPLDIGREPQFLFDLYTVDSTWGLHEKQELVRRVAHTCRKHAANPLWPSDYSNPPAHFWAVRDPDGLFRIWYQLNQRIHFPNGRQKGQMAFRRYMGYAQSKDGIAWEHPNLDLFESQEGVTLPRNCVMHRPESPRSMMGDTPQIVEVPERDRRGYRYHMLYLGTGGGGFNGIRLIGSKDGIHWDLKSDTLLADISSDHHNTVVYDPGRDEYVMYLRAKDIYLAPGQGKEPINAGQSRRGVARMTSKELWTQWASRPQTVISPDETDALTKYNYFYGMPVRRFAGIYWGFVQAFRWNDFMHPQLAWSRDGINFDRMPDRPKLIEYGADGSWDDCMLLACPNWIEVGDEWWIFYNGWDGFHETPERNGNIGLAIIRKEGFISLRGPAGGGVVCTRSLRWPGGELAVNADARKGELRVRVSDTFRKPRAGYNFDDCAPFTEDSVAHRVAWKGKPLDALKGEVIRLEFLLRDADLYTFRASG